MFSSSFKETTVDFVLSEGQNAMINLPFCESEDVSQLIQKAAN